MLAAVAGIQYCSDEGMRSDGGMQRLQYRSDEEMFLRRVDTASPAITAGLT